MATHTESLPLSNGGNVRVRVERGPTGDAVLHEQNSNNPNGGGRIYWSGHGLYLMAGRELVRMQSPRFTSAESGAEAAELALGFFAECAENCIRYARAEGIPVEVCYTT